MKKQTANALDQWLKSLTATNADRELVGFTTYEAAKAIGVCVGTMSTRIREKVEAGELKPAKAMRMTRTGINKPTDVYLPVSRAKRK